MSIIMERIRVYRSILWATEQYMDAWKYEIDFCVEHDISLVRFAHS